MRCRLRRGVGHLARLRQPGAYGAGGRRAQHRLRGEGQPRHEPVGVARLGGGRGLDVGDAVLLGEAAGRLHQRAAHALAAEPLEDVRRDGQHGRLEVERREGRGLEVDRAGDLAVDLGHRDAVVVALAARSRSTVETSASCSSSPPRAGCRPTARAARRRQRALLHVRSPASGSSTHHFLEHRQWPPAVLSRHHTRATLSPGSAIRLRRGRPRAPRDRREARRPCRS